MQVKVLAFAVVKEIFNQSSVEVDLGNASTVGGLKILLEDRYPRLKQLSSYMIAVNDEYADAKQVIEARDEIAIIPPVSGG